MKNADEIERALSSAINEINEIKEKISLFDIRLKCKLDPIFAELDRLIRKAKRMIKS